MADSDAAKRRKAELESSATSLNRQSWVMEEPEGRDTTPLIRTYDRTKGPAAIRQGEGELEPGAAGVSYSTTLDSDNEEGRRSLFVTRAVYGEVRNCHQRLSWVEWLFIIIATSTIIGVLGMSVERFVMIRRTFVNMTPDPDNDSSYSGSGDQDQLYCSHWSCLNDFTFAVMGLVNWIFCIYYCYGGLLRERPFEIVGYALTVFILFTYVVINFFVEGEQGDLGKLIRLILAVVLGPLNIVLSLVVQNRMGFLVIGATGSKDASRLLTRAYHSRMLFFMAQIFNIQILANILVLSWVKAGHFTGLGEKIVLPSLLVFMTVLAYLGWLAVLWENKPLAIAWIFLAMLSLGYYMFKIVNVGAHWSYYKEVYTDYTTCGQTSYTHFLYIAILLLFSCFLGMLVCIALAVLMLTVLGNFDKGLKERMPPPRYPCCSRHSEELTEHD